MAIIFPTNVKTTVVPLDDKQSTISHVLVNQFHLSEAEMRQYGPAIKIWIAACNGYKNIDLVSGKVRVPEDRQAFFAAIGEFAHPQLPDQESAFVRGQRALAGLDPSTRAPPTAKGLCERSPSAGVAMSSGSRLAAKPLPQLQAEAALLLPNPEVTARRVAALLSNKLKDDDKCKHAARQLAEKYPGLAAWVSGRSPEQLSEFKDQLAIEIDKMLSHASNEMGPSDRAKSLAASAVESLVLGSSFIDLHFSDAQLQTIKTFFSGGKGASAGLSSDTTVVDSQQVVDGHQAEPPKAGGLYAETASDGRCRQFTVFVPTHKIAEPKDGDDKSKVEKAKKDEEARLGQVKKDLIGQINAENAGYTAVDGGKNVINITPNGVNKGRIYPYLEARFGWKPSDVLVLAKSDKGNDAPLRREGAEFEEVKGPDDFSKLMEGMTSNPKIKSHVVILTTSSALFTGDDLDERAKKPLYDLLVTQHKTIAIVSGRKPEDFKQIARELNKWAATQHPPKRKLMPAELEKKLIYGVNNCAWPTSAARLSASMPKKL
jgi:trehalose-6-phosphatase